MGRGPEQLIDVELSPVLQLSKRSGPPPVSNNKKIRFKEFVEDYELSITPIHETRHFHDALLSHSLFELFVIKFKENIFILQLPKFIEELYENDLPIDIEEFKSKLKPAGQFLLQEIIRSETIFNSRFQQLFRSFKFCGRDISISFLLECNAIATEIMSLIIDFGTKAATYYYENVVLNLPIEYRFLLEIYVDKYKNLEQAITTVNRLTSYCLYFFDNPVEKFIDIFKNDDSLITTEKIIYESINKEESLRQRIDKMRIVDVKGGKTEIPTSNGPMDLFFKYMRLVYDCRKKLRKKYIEDYHFSFKYYLSNLGELPNPPVVFYPTDTDTSTRNLKGVSEDSLKRSKRPFHTIAGSYENDSMVLIAGLTTLASHIDSALPFELIDIMLVNQYIFFSLFEKGKDSEILYNQSIDYMYNKIFKKHYLT